MKNKFLSLLGATCSLMASLYGQCLVDFGDGVGFDQVAQVYRWDTGALSSVVTLTTDFAAQLGPNQLTGENAPSVAQAFSTTHRGLPTDTIVAIQVAFTDINASFGSFQCREGNHFGTTNIPTVGQKVILAIWEGSVPAGCQKVCNACYTQEYTIQPADIGITSNFKTQCPSFTCDCFDSPCGDCEDFCNITSGGVACPNCSLGDCGSCPTGACGCIFEGNGSNIRPLIADTGADGCENHTRRVPPNVNQGTGQEGKNPFSEYTASFTTILLNQAVTVTGTFWVGLIYDFADNTLPPLVSPNDNFSFNPLGLSVVNFSAPQPQSNGIDLSNIPQFNSSAFLVNNALIPVNNSNPLGLHPIANGFNPLPVGFLTGDALPRRQDEFYTIRAVPLPLGMTVICTTPPENCQTGCPNNGCPTPNFTIKNHRRQDKK